MTFLSCWLSWLLFALAPRDILCAPLPRYREVVFWKDAFALPDGDDGHQQQQQGQQQRRQQRESGLGYRVHGRGFSDLAVDPQGYPLPDIAGDFGMARTSVNGGVPRWRDITRYEDGQRRYTNEFRPGVLELTDGGAVQGFGADHVMIYDAKNVYVTDDCGRGLDGFEVIHPHTEQEEAAAAAAADQLEEVRAKNSSTHEVATKRPLRRRASRLVWTPAAATVDAPSAAMAAAAPGMARRGGVGAGGAAAAAFASGSRRRPGKGWAGEKSTRNAGAAAGSQPAAHAMYTFSTLAVMVHRYSQAYFHWVLEALPRLLVYERFFANARRQRELQRGRSSGADVDSGVRASNSSSSTAVGATGPATGRNGVGAGAAGSAWSWAEEEGEEDEGHGQSKEDSTAAIRLPGGRNAPGDGSSGKVHFLIDPTPYARETLRLLGIDEPTQAVFFDAAARAGRATFRARRLLVASATPCGSPPRPLLLLLRARMHQALYPRSRVAMPAGAGEVVRGQPAAGAAGAAGAGVERRRAAAAGKYGVLVQRDGSRRIANLDAVREVMEHRLLRLGVSEVRLFDLPGPRRHRRTGGAGVVEVAVAADGSTGGEQSRRRQQQPRRRMTFVEQYALFHGARIIVGAHGAGTIVRLS